MFRSTVAEIDLKALANNWRVLNELQDLEQLIPVIKANAYGHGVLAVAQQCQQWGVKCVAVALLEEAVEVRAAGYGGDILILGPFGADQIPQAQELRCTPMVGEKQLLIDLAATKFKGSLHLKWNTGMNRLGLEESDLKWIKNFLKDHAFLRVEALCTHFLKGDDLGQKDSRSEQQLQVFQRIESHFPGTLKKHILNSDSLFMNHLTGRLDRKYGARPGIALYGYCGVKTEWSTRLQPVMTLKTNIVHFSHVAKGATVSYNGTWTARRDSKVAVLPIGYADGYPRHLSNKGQVFVRGHVVPLVGTVCMDYFMIDVSDVPGVELGDEVELWGKNVSLYKLAEAADTITYELLTALTSRVPRKVLL